MGLVSDGLDRATQRAFTRPIPKSAGAQMRYLVKQLKGTRAVAQLLGISQRTVERYVKDQIRRPRPDLAGRLADAVRARWQPRVREQARRQAATTTGIIIDTRARFGFTAAPGATDDARLRHLTLALGKPPLLPGRFPGGRQPAWEAAAAWMTALPVNRLTALRAHRLTTRRAMHLLQLQVLTGIHLTLVCHRPHLPAALHQALQTADYSVITDFQAARRHYYGTPITQPPPADEPAGLASRWLTMPAHGPPRLLRQSPPLRRPVHAAPDRLAAPPTARSSHPVHRGARRSPAARGDRTSPPGRSRRRRAVHRCLPFSNSPPPAPATTTTPRPHSPCTTAPAYRRLRRLPRTALGRCLPADRNLLYPARLR